MKTVRAAIPIAAIFVAFLATAASAGTGDMGVLAAARTPSTQFQNTVVFLGLVACTIGAIVAGMYWLKHRGEWVHTAEVFLGVVAAVVIIKNVGAWILGIAGVGATF